MPINIVIPMAGEGSRFVQAGFSKPKPFIDVLGKPMITHVMDNLAIPDARYILIAREAHLNAEPEVAESILKTYNAEFVTLDQLTEGAVCTVLHAQRSINNNTPLLIANSDQIVDSNLNDWIHEAQDRQLDGSILTFYADETKWSYAKINQHNLVTEVREKEVISPHATVGLYYFTRGSEFVSAAIDMIVRNDRVNNEFYVCPVYNYVIRAGLNIGIYDIKPEEMHGLGTPDDFAAYIKLKNSLLETVV